MLKSFPSPLGLWSLSSKNNTDSIKTPEKDEVLDTFPHFLLDSLDDFLNYTETEFLT